MTLPSDKQERKQTPLFSGVLDYFPDALAAVAQVSFIGNEQHNPGQPLHWAKHKSTDHADCLLRHLMEAELLDDDGSLHAAKVAWRGLALCQMIIEAKRAGMSLSYYIQKIKSDSDIVLLPSLSGVFTQEDYNAAESGTRSCLDGPTSFEKEEENLEDLFATVYIAGPMTGYPLFNFPAFDAAKEMLETNFFNVISPADLDREAGFEPDADHVFTEEQLAEVIQRDLDAIMTLKASRGDAIALLPGWEKSKGACAEFMLARWKNLRILDGITGRDYDLNEINWTAMIVSFVEWYRNREEV